MKKKGFTLIELLAVIVILAIIALIATPLVLKYIDKSNKEALKNSIYSIDRAILMKGTVDRKDKEYTTIDELDVKIKDTDIKISYINGETRYYKVSNENYLLDVKKCSTKEYCTIEEIETIKDVIINKSNMFPKVEDSNPGIICGDGTVEDTTLTTCHIRSIEDLVQLSTLVNKGTTFQDKTVELVYSLDFNDKKSYASKKVDDSLIKDAGFTPIGNSSRKFQGTFNGNNNTIKGLYINRPETSYIGLFGNVENSLISNLIFEDINLVGNGIIGVLCGRNMTGVIENIKLTNIKLEAKASNSYVGSLVGNNKATKISNISSENINIVAAGGYTGGLIGYHSNETLQNITINNINIISNSGYNAGGLVGVNDLGTIKSVIGNNIKIDKETRGSGGLVGSNSGNIMNVKLTNVDVTGYDYVGGLVGSTATNSIITNCKISGIVKGSGTTGLVVGISYSTNIHNVVIDGSAEGGSVFGGFMGYQNWDKTPLQYISGVNITQKMIASSGELKSLDNMGKVSQSEYEALGFEFESTDTNEAYWYFNDNDELDLIIK